MPALPNAQLITDAIYSAVDELNKQLRKSQRLAKTPETRITGDGALDSLGLLNLIVLVEQKVEQTCGVSVSLADDQLIASHADAFQTLGTLTEFVQSLITAKNQG